MNTSPAPAYPPVCDLVAELNRSAPVRRISAVIENLNISADAKSLLNDLSRITMKVGTSLFSLGKVILTFVIDLVKRFPNTTFGAIIGLTVSTLVSGIPLVGALLGPIIGPLFLALGLSLGALADLKEAGIRAEIDALNQKVAIVSARA